MIYLYKCKMEKQLPNVDIYIFRKKLLYRSIQSRGIYIVLRLCKRSCSYSSFSSRLEPYKPFLADWYSQQKNAVHSIHITFDLKPMLSSNMHLLFVTHHFLLFYVYITYVECISATYSQTPHVYIHMYFCNHSNEDMKRKRRVDFVMMFSHTVFFVPQMLVIL